MAIHSTAAARLPSSFSFPDVCGVLQCGGRQAGERGAAAAGVEQQLEPPGRGGRERRLQPHRGQQPPTATRGTYRHTLASRGWLYENQSDRRGREMALRSAVECVCGVQAGEGKGDGDEDEDEEDEEDELPAPFERKDVWDVKWAEDDPNSIAVMEKTRLYVPPSRDVAGARTLHGLRTLTQLAPPTLVQICVRLPGVERSGCECRHPCPRRPAHAPRPRGRACAVLRLPRRLQEPAGNTPTHTRQPWSVSLRLHDSRIPLKPSLPIGNPTPSPLVPNNSHPCLVCHVCVL